MTGRSPATLANGGAHLVDAGTRICARVCAPMFARVLGLFLGARVM